jgi:hypothetical protein
VPNDFRPRRATAPLTVFGAEATATFVPAPRQWLNRDKLSLCTMLAIMYTSLSMNTARAIADSDPYLTCNQKIVNILTRYFYFPCIKLKFDGSSNNKVIKTVFSHHFVGNPRSTLRGR